MNSENTCQTEASRPETAQDATHSGGGRLRTLGNIDGRTRCAKLAQRLVSSLEGDLGGDLSTAQSQLVQRAAMIGALVEDIESRWLARQPADLEMYGRLVDRQRRLLEVLGLKRLPRDITAERLDRLIDAVRETSP